MALSWTMDKLGPIARSVEDCALVLGAIHGRDGRDLTAVDRPFDWPLPDDARRLRIGYVPDLFDEDRAAAIGDDAGSPDEVAAMRAALDEWAAHDRRTLEVMRSIGFELVPVELPAGERVDALQIILLAEAAAAFDELTRSGRDDLLVRQEEQAWPNVFRYSQLIPAVEYLRASRLRTLVMEEMEARMREIDVFVAPSFGGNHLLLTNLTGHPAVVLPNGFRSGDGTPTSITFTGKLHGETELLAVAKTYQDATEFHLAHPTL
jgi:Asp-tRNA(Asn)/Glu-tRNA(Gln) amidotransferase A subunit family amidase